MSRSLNIIFAGTPEFAAIHLSALIHSEHKVVAVYCPPDKPSGRGKKLTPCAVKQIALDNDIHIEQPNNFKNPLDIDRLAAFNADIMVVVAYGLLLPEPVLNAFPLGCINVHGSILPKWRGAAPIQRSLQAGDQQTGVTIMQMDKGLDTGAMLLKSTCDITDTDTSATLYDKLAALGPTALIDTLALLKNGHAKPEPQNNQLATYAHKLEKSEAEINWHQPATNVHQQIRAFIPWPISQFTFFDSAKNEHHIIRVWQASVVKWQGTATAGTILTADKSTLLVATTNNAIQLEILQLPGKKALPINDIMNARGTWFEANKPITGLT